LSQMANSLAKDAWAESVKMREKMIDDNNLLMTSTSLHI
jgi:hypothetical protein